MYYIQAIMLSVFRGPGFAVVNFGLHCFQSNIELAVTLPCDHNSNMTTCWWYIIHTI